jgi:hypothetical protein
LWLAEVVVERMALLMVVQVEVVLVVLEQGLRYQLFLGQFIQLR